MSLGKWEIEGELYVQINYYDQYGIDEPYIITSDMNRDNIIYNGVGHRFNFEENKWEYDKEEKKIACGKLISQWIEEVCKLVPCAIKSRSVMTPHKDSQFCSLHEESFQPQTKKVRITIEEIE